MVKNEEPPKLPQAWSDKLVQGYLELTIIASANHIVKRYVEYARAGTGWLHMSAR